MMLTFEEFFQKKKINLAQLKITEPGLFAEFSQHYPLMGEKSFDHTKKYHFNYLRRTYPLSIIIKPHPVQAEDISNMAVQGIAVAAAQNLDTDNDRPKFKEDNLVQLSEQNIPEKDISLAEAEQVIRETGLETTVFKPRFNPKMAPKTTEEPITESINEKAEPIIEPFAKPAFKPRFNMQQIKKEPVKTASDDELSPLKPVPENFDTPQETDQSVTDEIKELVDKPAFKPRFNPKNIPKIVVEMDEEKSGEPLLAEEPEPEKPAFKPTFNRQSIKKEPVKTVADIRDTEADQPKTEVVKPAYKPRFQMKNIPKPPAE
ncbi:MAG: hypothetical protein ACRYFB_07850 [Janthinobacterium lividum]